MKVGTGTTAPQLRVGRQPPHPLTCHEILIGWHIERVYIWPYVLLTYLMSLLIVGWLLHPRRRVHSLVGRLVSTLCATPPALP